MERERRDVRTISLKELARLEFFRGVDEAVDPSADPQVPEVSVTDLGELFPEFDATEEDY